MMSGPKIYVSTTQYVFKHGNEPGPTREGHWVFYFGTRRTAASAQNHPRFYHGMYAEVKRQAMADAHKEGHSKISVGS